MTDGEHREFVRELERKHWEDKHAQHDEADRAALRALLMGE